MTQPPDTTAAASLPPRSRPRRGRRIGVMLAVALALGGGAAYAFTTFGAAPPPAWRTAPVTLGTVERTVTAVGSLQPKNYVDVGAQISGQLTTLAVDIGERVEEGQLLGEIDARTYRARAAADRAQIKDLEAQLKMQKAQADLAKAQQRRNERLFKSNAVSQDALDIARTEAAVAEARIASLEAQLEQARSNLEADEASLSFTQIFAPMAGTVVSQETVAGQTLNANQSAPILMRIADLDTMTLEAQVAEADVPRLAPGMPLEFTTLGMPDRRWKTTVRQILPTPETVNDVVLYTVLADIPNPDKALMTDMTAQVFFIEGRASDTPVVPLAALQKAPGQGEARWSVRVLGPDGTVETRPVTVALRTRTEAALSDGVTPGETVIIGTAAGAGDRRPPMGPRL